MRLRKPIIWRNSAGVGWEVGGRLGGGLQGLLEWGADLRCVKWGGGRQDARCEGGGVSVRSHLGIIQ